MDDIIASADSREKEEAKQQKPDIYTPPSTEAIPDTEQPIDYPNLSEKILAPRDQELSPSELRDLGFILKEEEKDPAANHTEYYYENFFTPDEPVW